MSEESARLQGDYAFLAQKILQQMPESGICEASISGLHFARRDDPMRRENVLYPPCVGIVVQGTKQAVVGTREMCYQRGQYILCCVDMPSSFIVSGSPEEPYLTVLLRLDFPLLAEIFRELDAQRADKGVETAEAEAYVDGRTLDADAECSDLAAEDGFESCEREEAAEDTDDTDDELRGQDDSRHPGSVECGTLVCEITPEMLNAFLRLVCLLEKNPEDVRNIAPLIVREIHYYLATGPGGRILRAFLMSRTQSWQIVRAITHMRRNCGERLPIEYLARMVNMAESTFNRNFKKVTSLSPLQYHKHLKLFEARRLIMQEGRNAASACAAVGYESQQQFTREYKRLFGYPPMKDMRRGQR